MTPLTNLTHTAEELAQALKVAKLIAAKVNAALDPLEREMRLMGYQPKFREIMWQAVAEEAERRQTECAKG